MSPRRALSRSLLTYLGHAQRPLWNLRVGTRDTPYNVLDPTEARRNAIDAGIRARAKRSNLRQAVRQAKERLETLRNASIERERCNAYETDLLWIHSRYKLRGAPFYPHARKGMRAHNRLGRLLWSWWSSGSYTVVLQDGTVTFEDFEDASDIHEIASRSAVKHVIWKSASTDEFEGFLEYLLAWDKSKLRTLLSLVSPHSAVKFIVANISELAEPDDDVSGKILFLRHLPES